MKHQPPLPPGPSGYYLLRLAQLQQQPIDVMSHLWRTYGDLVRLPIMPGLTVLLALHPDAAEHVLSLHKDRYRKADFFLKSMGLLQGQGLFASEGQQWLQHRRIMQPAFQQRQLTHLQQVIGQCVQSQLTTWEAQPDDTVIDIAAVMNRLTLQIVSLALFGLDISDEANQVGQAFRSAAEYVYYRLNSPLAPPVWLPTPRNLHFRRAKHTLDRVVLDIIQSRRQGLTTQPDLLSMLLAAQDGETSEKLSDHQLRDEVITLIHAGYDTTATALAWTWYLLGTHPDVMAKMQMEAQTVLKDGELTDSHLAKLDYTRRVFEESLRLCPPGLGLAPRAAIEADQMCGYSVPKGTIVNVMSYFIARHPEFWDNPEQFAPDRFRPERVKQRAKFAHIPFGAGPHACIGKNLALMAAITILAAIVHRFEIELLPQQSIEIDPRFTLRPKYGIKVRVRKRY